MVITRVDHKRAELKNVLVEFMVAVSNAGTKIEFDELLMMSREVDRRRDVIRKEAAEAFQSTELTEWQIRQTEMSARKTADEQLRQLRYQAVNG